MLPSECRYAIRSVASVDRFGNTEGECYQYTLPETALETPVIAVVIVRHQIEVVAIVRDQVG